MSWEGREKGIPMVITMLMRAISSDGGVRTRHVRARDGGALGHGLGP